jgi:hypothetical protein
MDIIRLILLLQMMLMRTRIKGERLTFSNRLMFLIIIIKFEIEQLLFFNLLIDLFLVPFIPHLQDFVNALDMIPQRGLLL